MTDKLLTEYFSKNKDMFVDLAVNCTSVPELELKLSIRNRLWRQWDWALYLSYLLVHAKSENNCKTMFLDIIDAIDNSKSLDNVFTNKQVLLSMIYTINSRNMLFELTSSRRQMCTILAHVFKKFPSLWTMSWMYAKYKDPHTKQWKKYHRLQNIFSRLGSFIDDHKYYNSKKYYNDFIEEYFDLYEYNALEKSMTV